jgi:hypothetical protein
MSIAFALWLATTIDIVSEARCPELDRLGSASANRLVITRGDETIAVELVAPDGRSIGSRSLPARAECPALAAAVAVLVAAWESELAGELPPAISLGKEPRAAIGISAGAIGMLGVRSRGVGGTVAVTAERAASRWGVASSLGATVHERQALGPGDVGWFRIMLGVGGQLRLRPGGVRVAARGEALAGVLRASAYGYDSNDSDVAVTPGFAGVVRVQLGRPYVELGGVAWVRREHLHVAGVAGEVELPRAELTLGFGMTAGGP